MENWFCVCYVTSSLELDDKHADTLLRNNTNKNILYNDGAKNVVVDHLSTQ
jgi:hypothetical protein